MEIGQIQCKNLGMVQDLNISTLNEVEGGSLNFAFENHNIRITALNDNTNLVVTNEKGTIKETSYREIKGTFLGGCTLNNYLILFTKDYEDMDSINKDYIYRLNYIQPAGTIGGALNIEVLYNGNLNFDLQHPIEAIGYYEAEEVQKVYWVDGLNQNRFINIVADNNTRASWNNYSFDFQGRINSIPNVTITKNYNKAGTFQAGVIQYFITYYNEYGVETCLVYNSDLQYISLSDRGAKADEAVSCAFDFEITNIDTSYNYLRIYASYRSGINGVISTRILTDIDIKGKQSTDVIKFSDLGQGITFNSDDLFYIGGQKIIANTLDYKQDTLFLGDIHTNIDYPKIEFNKEDVELDIKDVDGNNVIIKEGKCNNTTYGIKPYLHWSYKYVSPIASTGVYSHTQEINQSQQEIAGFKWREIYRFGIQFISTEGEWSPVYWLGDKYCDRKPRVFTSEDIQGSTSQMLGCSVIKETIDSDGNIIKSQTNANYQTMDTLVNYTKDGCYIANISVDFDAIMYGAFVTNDQNIQVPIDLTSFRAYRLLIAETDITNRRIVEQGVLNPTMFNYNDRYYNKPYSIPSYIFRPRNSKITNRHYDTLPVQTEFNAELQGITTRQIPAETKLLDTDNTFFNSYLFIIGANTGPVVGKNGKGFIQWKLLYYNSGASEEERNDKFYMLNYTGDFDDTVTPQEIADIQTKVASLVYKYKTPLKLKTSPTGAQYIIQTTNLTEQQILQDYIQEDYIPMQIYGTNYKLISSHLEDEQKNGTKDSAKWTTLSSRLQEKISNDQKNTTAAEVGSSLAGQQVLVGEMLPNSDDLYNISVANQTTDIDTVLLITGAIVATVAAVLISVFTFGAASPAGITLATAAIGACTSALGSMALGMSAAAATKSIDISNMPDFDKKMLAKNYLKVNQKQTTSVATRRLCSKYISFTLERLFTPSSYSQNIITAHIGGEDTDYQIVELQGETNYPFRTGNAYTEKGCLGVDYIAYATAGLITTLTGNDEDLKKKQNLFCVDESIVTLNSPSIEKTNSIVNNSEALNLDIVGLIPIDATEGEYDVQAENGLNTSSQVIRGKYVTNTLQDDSSNVIGLLNANIYQDFKSSESVFDDPSTPVQVKTDAGLYKVFMWNRETSLGYHFPNIKLVDVFGNNITEIKGKLVHKIFANLRYSKNSEYYKPFNINIESPVSCLDSEVILKTFTQSDNVRTYYENVDTISVNNSYYPLVTDLGEYPLTETRINNGGIKDPIHIKYKQTPHILIPLKWANDTQSTILPYIENDKILLPTDLYGNEDSIKLYGTSDSIPVGKKYVYLKMTSGQSWLPLPNDDQDPWNIESTNINDYLTNAEINLFHTLTGVDLTQTTINCFLAQATKHHYYVVYSVKPTLLSQVRWYSKLVDKLAVNSIVFTDMNTVIPIVRYAVKNIDETGLLCTLTTNINDILDLSPIKSTWNQTKLPWRNTTSSPYLFIGELVKKVFDYNTWNGGFSSNALNLLNWNIASEVTPILNNITTTWGDTYYQRWDCQKTYPFTEEDTNSNVEILSCMLETHDNIDGRCDVNRGIFNLLNTRPYNTIYNDVYSQNDNIFSYKTLETTFDKKHFEADIVWSLTKNNLNIIDKWTNLVSTNQMSLDGRYGTIRKILNVNDVLVAFQDSGMATIKYNESVALNTQAGLPVQIANTGKVEGYRMLSDTVGCHNKFSINKNSAGVFFADDYNRTFNRFTVNGGIEDIGIKAKFSTWFKNNLTGQLWVVGGLNNIRSSYDEVTHDLYLTHNEYCLVYNTMLERFTSFMDYIKTPMMVRLNNVGNGESNFIAVRNENDDNAIYKLFANPLYGYIYDSFKPYSIRYRICPDPLHDSIFTNYQYSADWVDPGKQVDIYGQISDANRYVTFDLVEAWNEYQIGRLPITTQAMGRFPIKAKFRIWRGNIPRDGDNTLTPNIHGDRLRNPWIHIQFTKQNANYSKMIFHDLNITYYNQYGRL